MSIRRFSNENFSDKKRKVVSNLVTTDQIGGTTGTTLTSNLELSTQTVTQNSFDITQSINQSNQYSAEGSLLQNIPARVHPAENLLKQAVWWIDAAHSSAKDQNIKNLGWGGSALDARNGSTTGADSNDALYLPWDGENYVYLTGVSGNFMQVPDENALNITGDIDLRSYIAMDNWTPGVFSCVISKRQSGSNQAYELGINTNGTFRLAWTADGSTFISATSTVTSGIIDGTAKWIRATLDVNNGAGGYDAKFFLSDDGATWTQLGATVVGGSTTSIFAGTLSLGLMADPGGSLSAAGKAYRFQIFDGIEENGGTKVLDIDTSIITAGNQTTFPALTGQTVTINRSTSGRKSVAVVSPVWLLGTDDYMIVSENALMEFTETESFTLVAVIRQWDTPTNFGRWVYKGSDTGIRWGLISNGTSLQTRGQLVSTGNQGANGPTFTSGSVVVASQRVDRDTQTNTVFTNTMEGTAADTSTVLTLTNNLPLWIGRSGGAASYQDFELLSVAIFRRSLTQSEINTLTSYFQGRVGA